MAMWAYDCHYACESEIGPANVAFDSRIARITPESVTTTIDVGILKDMILVQYGEFNCVVL
jgi:hypothetical protein